jgi:phosphoribosylformylglycinamidine cyclo-ligase
LSSGNEGINLEKIRKAQQSLGEIISRTHSLQSVGKVISGFGHYAGIIDLGPKILALHCDGVGTKVIVAQMMKRYDTIGIDCVAMNVNDIICVGAKPFGFIDYIALRSANQVLLTELAKGLVSGAEKSGVAILGGETAVVPDIISANTSQGSAFDLAGAVVGIIMNKSKLILGNKIETGDIILGVESSGLHSNGYTLARKVLLSKYSLDHKPDSLSRTLGDELLTPTRIYVEPILEILNRAKSIPLHGLAHITGGSFTKLSRLNDKVVYTLDNMPVPSGIFSQIQLDGGIKTKEMYKTFNMGIGFCLILPRVSVESTIRIFEKYGMGCREIGRVSKKGRGDVIVRIDGKNQIL